MNKNELGKTIEDFGVWMQEMADKDVTDLAKEETPATIEDFALKLKELADEMSEIVDTMRIEAKKNKALTEELLGKSVAVGKWTYEAETTDSVNVRYAEGGRSVQADIADIAERG